MVKDLDHLTRVQFKPIYKTYLDTLRKRIADANHAASPIVAAADEYGFFVTSVTDLRATMKPKMMAVVEGWVRNDPGDWTEYVERITDERIKTFQDDLTAAGLAILKEFAPE